MKIKMVLFDKNTHKILAKFTLVLGLRAVLPTDITYIDKKALNLPECASDPDFKSVWLREFLNNRYPEHLSGEGTKDYDIRMGNLIGIDYRHSGFGRMDEELRGVISLVNKFASSKDLLLAAPESDQAFFLTELDKGLNQMFILRRWNFEL